MSAGRRRSGISWVIRGSGICLAVVAAASTVTGTGRWTVPRTTEGRPDFQDATWEFSTMTPLERPTGVETAVLTEAEAAAFERRSTERSRANNVNGPDWWDDGSHHLDRRRTSLIIDPPDGRLPSLTPEAQQRAVALRKARQGGPADGPEQYSLNARCIWWQSAGPPMLPVPYNDNVQFIQTRDVIVILNENMHDARVVPMDGRPHGSIRQWMGDSRGRWDGDTLVVDTTMFSNKTSLRGSDENLHIVERFTRIDADTIEYQFTAEDPTVWIRPWTAALRMHRTTDPLYEFACHEGNSRSMEGLLRAARTMDKAPAREPR